MYRELGGGGDDHAGLLTQREAEIVDAGVGVSMATGLESVACDHRVFACEGTPVSSSSCTRAHSSLQYRRLWSP